MMKNEYSIRLVFIHHCQKFATELLPRGGHSMARLERFNSASHFLIPSLLNGFILHIKVVA